MKRYAVLTIVLLVSGIAGGVAWHRWPRTPLPEPPALDPSGVDTAVWRTVEAARGEVRRDPQSSRAWGRLGMLLLAHQFRAESVVCLAHAEQLDPREARWPYYQALAVRRSDPETAIAALRRAIAVDRDDYDALPLLLGDLLVQRGPLDEAETRFRDVLRRDAHNSRAHLGLAQAAFERDDLADCLTHLRQATDDPRTRKAAHTFLAVLQQRRGDRAAAEKALADAQSLPDDAPWPDPLAESVQSMVVGHLEAITHAAALLQQNQAEQAISLLQRAIEDYPESSWARVLLGRAWLRLHNLSAAEQALTAAAKLAPDSVEAQFYLGVVLSEQEKYTEAIPYFRKATQLKADYALAWYNLGFCRKQQGDRAAAREAFRTAIACKPQFAEARINLGELLADDGEIDAALSQLRQAVKLAPTEKRAQQLLETLRKRAKGN
jgi:tetratricopeptide (TPR) repeat protein